MRRLTSNQLKEIENLIKDGKSLKKIAKITNLSKTTVYYHFRKLKGRTIKYPIFNFSSDEELGEVVGIFAGDGSLHFIPENYRYVVRIHSSLRNIDYLMHVKTLYERCFGVSFPVRKYKTRRFLEKNSKLIFYLFFNYLDFDPRNKSNTVKLKNIFSKKFNKGFLRGLLDTDGTFCIDNEGKLRLVYYTSSKELSKRLKIIIKNFGFECNISMSKNGCNQVFLYRSSIRNFARFLNSYKVNRRIKSMGW